MSQITFDFGPWSGYGWITVRGRQLFALVYHTWNRWFALPKDNPNLRRALAGTLDHIEAFGNLIKPLTTRKEQA